MKVRKILSALLVLLLLFGLTACGSAQSEAADNYYSMETAAAPAEKPASGLVTDSSTESGSASTLPADRKLIRTIRMEAETEDLAALQEDLNARITELGGYVEGKNLYNGSNYAGYRRRSLNMTVRIPADRADAFVTQVGENSNIVSSSESIDDVTLQYVDTESRVKALETEQERLLDLLSQAENLEEILQIEDRLTHVRYELESYASQLRTLQNQVSYATVHLNITEVKEYTPVVEEEPTMWQQITDGFTRSLRDIGEGAKSFVIWLLANSPYLLIWVLVIVAVTRLLRKRGKPIIRRKKPVKPPEDKTE